MTPPTYPLEEDEMAAHTPGPWTVYEPTSVVVSMNDGVGYAIADPSARVCWPAEQVAANARLIAAAPELLDACRRLLERFGYLNWPDGCDADLIESACVAFRRATDAPLDLPR